MGEHLSSGALRVLVVDDWPDTAESMASLLRIWGHEVRVAGDGPSALALAADLRPDAVLLDVGLPGMDGYEVARRFRGDPDLRRAFLVTVSGRDREAEEGRSREAGCDRHLMKPVDLDALRRLLASARPAAASAGEAPAPPELLPAESAERRLRGNPYLALKNVSCEFRGGVLTLLGCLPSYYLKQVAQTAVAGVSGVREIHNDIAVVGPRPGPVS
jgi:CheY-like chemotaxis protein